ncbi:DUF4190 domain-containing protein [Gordonia hongkongensis]|uniref:DUF4190 domain-containing protein n=1 Tax=Gordonia hongkongensis TaxID=1701090 RepID=UPI001FFAB999|nr:DUF4190 domain-containing protein [Gordonia hongkongensis]UPG67357.1 DUF4190 domain-containing protein [Gordonia hongkongensis]
MRTDQPTQPFAPPVTQRHARWPLVNDLDDTELPAAAEPTGTRVDVHVAVPASPKLPTRVEPAAESSPWMVTRNAGRLPAREHAALPPVGDFWGLENARRAPLAAMPLPARTFPARSAPYLTRPVGGRSVAPAASLALTSGLISLPLTLLLGLGAILGLIAVVAGAVGVRQVRRAPAERKGTGRAITGIVTGAGSVIVGGPILFLVLLLAGL